MMMGWVDGRRTAPVQGSERMGAGLAAFAATGSEIVLPFYQTLRAELMVEHGDAERALSLLGDAVARIEQWGERWQEPEVHRVRGLALAKRGEADAAERAFQRAVECAREQGALSWELRARRCIAEHLAERG
jgi:predicted ATPase